MTIQQRMVSYTDLADSPEFAEFFEIVRNLTGVLVGLVDPEKQHSRRLFPESAENPLCRLIKSRPAGLAACQATDSRHCVDVALAKEGEVYLCHAGLMDMAVPIIVHDQLIATINCGQVLPASPTPEGYRELQRRCAALNLPALALREAYYASPSLSQEKIRTTLRLLTFFAEYFCEVGDRLISSRPGAVRAEIERAQHYARRHFPSPIRLEDVAAHVGLSPAYFSTLFHRSVGEPFIHYVQRLRVEEAQRLLLTTTEEITTIGLHVGFRNMTHFLRVFKQFTGCPPGTYRARHTVD